MFRMFKMEAVTVLLTTFVVFFVMISSSKASTCTVYKGGIFPLHRYICCNNCGEDDTSCDGRTWQGGSNEVYCGNCGMDTFGGKAWKNFMCLNCNTQVACATRADGWFGILDIKGLCWKWASSFESCCQKAVGKNKNNLQVIDINSTSFTFCGDGICQDDETSTSCPLDCCYQVNSNCPVSGCTPTCCGESSCCLEDGSGSG